MSKKRSLKVEVNPAVLAWAIKSAGWDEKELIDKLGISPNVYKGWMDGSVKPTLNQLENLSNKTKRPLSAFFLSEAPKEKELPKDYRMIPDREGKFDRKTIIAIRKARRWQEATKELSANINETLKPTVKKFSTKDNSKETAKYFRNEVFKLNEEKHTKFGSDYELYNFLRETIEEMNIIPFQISMPVEDARGFALVDEIPKTIVVNSKDEIRPRIFSLMHEFAHVLIDESGVSFPDLTRSIKNDVEDWCDTFASEFLLPESTAKRIFTDNKDTLTSGATLKRLSNKYYVSKGMLLYNMNKLNYITRSTYSAILNTYKEKPKPKPKKGEKKQGGGVPSDVRCKSEMGGKFISLVADNYDKGFITYADALGYLSVKSSKFKKVLKKATK